MEKFIKYWKWITLVGGVMLSIAGYIYVKGGESKSLEGKTFDSPEQKVKHVNFVNNSPDPKEQWQKIWNDSANKKSQILEREKRTQSILKSNSDHKTQDSLTFDMLKRMAVTQQTTNARLDSIIKKQ